MVSNDTNVQWKAPRICWHVLLRRNAAISSRRVMMPCKLNTIGRAESYPLAALAHVSALLLLAAVQVSTAAGAWGSDRQGEPDAAYPRMPQIAPIGVRIRHPLEIPEHAKGLTVDPMKGYRLEQLGTGLYMITD